MHPYSINSEEHKYISLYLAVIAILLAWALYLFSKNVFPLPWWIEAPSVRDRNNMGSFEVKKLQ